MAKTDLTNQRQVFVEEYVRSGDHLEAAKKAGYKDTHTLRNQACKLRRECADQITDELHRNFAEIAPRALNIQSDLLKNAESESIRIGGTSNKLRLKIVTKVNGKDGIWSTSTLRFTNSENLFHACKIATEDLFG